MCGLAGLLTPGQSPDTAVLARMSDALVHRGPDDAGIWQEGPVAFAHRRLAVVDLSSAGAQPMHSASGRYVIAYNGEIYNTPDLKAQLPALAWRGHSDTEVLLAGIEHLGLERTLAVCDGMFAFALFDRHERTLWLVRDRFGEKPLWFGWVGKTFVFASELSAIRAAFPGQLQPDRDALAGYLRHNYLPAERSAFAGIQKIPPGTCIRLTMSRAERGDAPDVRSWWSLESAIQSVDVPSRPEDVEDAVLNLLRRSIRGRMVADVPVGAFLSGGIDSSLVTAVMQEMSSSPVHTFTMGFAEAAWDEAPHADAVAEHLGTKHTTLRINEQDLLDAAEQLPDVLSEPFADSSFLPTWLLSRLCRQHVTVALSGDAGDELFWGYRRYVLWERACRLRHWMPRPIRHAAGALLMQDGVQSIVRRLTAGSMHDVTHSLGDRLHRIGELLKEPDDRSLYRALISHAHSPDNIVPGSNEVATVYSDASNWVWRQKPWRAAALADTLAYLPNDILTKVDRASMAASLETRIPLLDHRLAAFACALPRAQVIDALGAKRPLRRLLARYVPPELTERPKQGFGVPLNIWLRGPLKLWLGDVLSEQALRAQALLDVDTVIAMRDAHFSQDADLGPQLWDFAMLTAWFGHR